MADYPSKYTGQAVDDSVELTQKITIDPTKINTLSDIKTSITVQDQLNEKYIKPGSGIPRTDLSKIDVQNSLDLADTSEQVKYKTNKIYAFTDDILEPKEEYLKRYSSVSAVYDYVEQETKSYYAYKKVCMYLGKPDTVNNLTLEACVDFYSNFDIVIFGAGYQKPTHVAYTNTKFICEKLIAKGIEVYGYIDATSNLISVLEEDISQWNDLNCQGIYFDHFEYREGSEEALSMDRDKQNELVSYCHELKMYTIVQSTSVSNLFDATYDEKFNPHQLDAQLGNMDYFVFSNLFYAALNATAMKNCCQPLQVHEIYKYRTEIRSDKKDTWYNYYGTKILSFDTYASELDTLEKNKLATLSIIGAALLNIDAIAICDESMGVNTLSYWNWQFPADISLYPAPERNFSEYKKIGDDQKEFYYRFSNIINNHTYSIQLNYKNGEDYLFASNKEQILDGEDVISNVWDLYERKANKTAVLTADSTHQQFPTAKIVYDRLVEEHDYVGTSDLEIKYIHNNTDAGGTPITDSVVFNANSHINKSISITPDLASTETFGEIRVGHNLEIGEDTFLHALPGIVVSNVAPTHPRDTFWLDTSTPGYDINAIEHISNKVLNINDTSTDSEYPTAKAVWTTIRKVIDGEMEIPR